MGGEVSEHSARYIGRPIICNLEQVGVLDGTGWLGSMKPTKSYDN